MKAPTPVSRIGTSVPPRYGAARVARDCHCATTTLSNPGSEIWRPMTHSSAAAATVAQPLMSGEGEELVKFAEPISGGIGALVHESVLDP